MFSEDEAGQDSKPASTGRLVRGRVKFYREEKGWGGITSPDLPADVWVHFSAIDMPGYRKLAEGDEVELRYRDGPQDSWQYVATWVRRI
jgi:cold shock protein